MLNLFSKNFTTRWTIFVIIPRFSLILESGKGNFINVFLKNGFSKKIIILLRFRHFISSISHKSLQVWIQNFIFQFLIPKKWISYLEKLLNSATKYFISFCITPKVIIQRTYTIYQPILQFAFSAPFSNVICMQNFKPKWPFAKTWNIAFFKFFPSTAIQSNSGQFNSNDMRFVAFYGKINKGIATHFAYTRRSFPVYAKRK